MQYLLVQTLQYVKCKHGDLISECECDANVYVDRSKSKTSLVCDKQIINVLTPIPVCVSNMPEIAYTYISPSCPVTQQTPTSKWRVIAFLNGDNQKFFCCNATICSYNSIQLEAGTRVSNCGWSPCLDRFYGLIVEYGSVCQQCPVDSCGYSSTMLTCPAADQMIVDKMYCATCATFNAATCTASGVLTCNEGSYKQQQFYCETCPSDAICHADVLFSCQDLGGKECQNNLITECLETLTLASNRSLCIQCPKGAVCDTFQIINCKVGEFLEKKTCNTCDTKSICDGIQQQTCVEAGGQVCVDNQIQTCQTQKPLLDTSGLVCRPCAIGSYQKGQQCAVCAGNVICDGFTQQNCDNSELNIASCNGKVTKCQPNYLPSEDQTKCVSSKHFGALTSDGTMATSCLAHLILANSRCESCPTNYLCDGKAVAQNCSDAKNVKNALICVGSKIERCKSGFALLNKVCQDCANSALPELAHVIGCDGFWPTSCVDGYYLSLDKRCVLCDQQENMSCKDGVVTRCNSGFVPSLSGTGCQLCATAVGLQRDCGDGEQIIVRESGGGRLGYFKRNETFMIVFQCPDGAQCDGVQIVRCALGYRVDRQGKSCVPCYDAVFCDGVEQIECGAKNRYNAKVCRNGLIKQCAAGFLLSRDFNLCIGCTLKSGDFDVVCAGGQDFRCEKNGAAASAIAYVDVANNYLLECRQCPERATCDGKQIIECEEPYVSSGLGCFLSVVPDCVQGQSLRYCRCRSGRVFFLGSNVTGLGCDAKNLIEVCVPKATKAEMDGARAVEENQTTNCSCLTSLALVFAFQFNHYYYCIQGKNESENGVYDMRINGDMQYAAPKIKNGSIFTVDNGGYIYSPKILMQCMKPSETCNLKKTACILEEILIDEDLNDSFCLNYAQLENEQISNYLQMGQNKFKMCNGKEFRYCGQESYPKLGVYEFQCAIDFMNASFSCLKAVDRELFDGNEVVRCNPKSHIFSNTCTKPSTTSTISDGLTNTMCSNFNAFNASACNGYKITKCDFGFYLVDNQVCIVCPISRTSQYTPKCDGSEEILCFSQETERKFVYQFNKTCVPCPPGETCDGINLLVCENGKMSRNRECVLCPPGMFCNGSAVAFGCNGDFGVKSCENGVFKCLGGYKQNENLTGCEKCESGVDCVEGKITKCLDSMVLNRALNRCEDCPAGAVCANGVSVDSCPIGSKPEAHQCVACVQADEYCTGTELINCADPMNSLKAARCTNSAIISCLDGYLVNMERSACVQCSSSQNVFNALSCDGSKITACQPGFVLHAGGQSCENCSAAGNLLNARACFGNIITQCVPGFYLISRKCSRCAENTTDAQRHCDGSETVRCSFGRKSTPGVAMVFSSKIVCAACPSDYICDGVNVTRCRVDMRMEGGRCVKCAGNQFCDGMNEANCSQNGMISANIVQCVDGNVSLCEAGYVVDRYCRSCVACPAVANYSVVCPGGTFILCTDLLTGKPAMSGIQGSSDTYPKCAKCPLLALSCNGTMVEACVPTAYSNIYASNCYACGSTHACDGLNQYTCGATSPINASDCRAGVIQHCNEGHFFGRDNLTCSKCPTQQVDGMTVICNTSAHTFSCIKDGVEQLGDQEKVGLFWEPRCKICPALKCKNENVTLCLSNNFIVNGVTCQMCELTSFCNGVVQIACPSENIHAEVCHNGAIQLCADEYILDLSNINSSQCLACPNTENLQGDCDGTQSFSCFNTVSLTFGYATIFDGSVFCQSCPINAQCDGMVITMCPPGNLLSQNQKSCTQCQSGFLCVGDTTQQQCSDQSLHIKTCKDGMVLECQNNYYNWDNRSCELSVKCQLFEYFAPNSTCQLCPENNFCDGQNLTSCDSKNSLFAVKCENSTIVECQQSFYLKNQKSCIPCQEAEDSFFPFCNGIVLRCYQDGSDPAVRRQVYLGFVAGTQRCLKCQSNWQCDGDNIVRCQPGLWLTPDSKQCIQCSGSDYCDGSSNQLQCSSQAVNGENCSQGQIVKCFGGYQKIVEQSGNTICKKCENQGDLCHGDEVIFRCSGNEAAYFAKTCGSGVIDSCIMGYKLINRGSICIACAKNHLCVGDESEISCTVGQNSLNVELCEEGKIKQCELSFLNKIFECESCGPTDKFCDGFTREPTPCSGNGLEKCELGKIKTCKVGYTLIEQRTCEQCQEGVGSDVFCNGTIRLDCNGLSYVVDCAGGLIKSCDVGRKIAQLGRVCEKCENLGNKFCAGDNVVDCGVDNEYGADQCSDGLITRCVDGKKLKKQQCQDCDLNMICDGVAQKTCEQAHGAVCSFGMIDDCEEFYHFNNPVNPSRVKCMACEGESSITGCPAFKDCLKKSQRRELYICIDCSEGQLCNGTNKWVNCSLSNNELSAVQCNGTHIIECKNEMYLVGQTCTLCPTIPELPNINPLCNGIIFVQCYTGSIQMKQVIEKETIVNGIMVKSCYPCPDEATCDGKDVIRCAVGFTVKGGKQCDKCIGNKICNGFEELACEDVKGTKTCQDGKIVSCKDGFEISGDQSGCVAGKDGCGTACAVGISIAVVVVLGAFCVVLQLLYFKQQKAKIQQAVFRNVDSVRAGRAVDHNSQARGRYRLREYIQESRESGFLGPERERPRPSLAEQRFAI